MKNIILSACVSLLLCNTAVASDMTISGTAQFRSNLLSKYMIKNGYHYIKEMKIGYKYKTNLFAAGDAEVIVKNMNDIIVGSGRTDEKGNFLVSVPGDSSYQIVVRYHNREITKVVTVQETENITLDLMFFKSEEIDSWHERPALTYCYTCNIRYLENKETL